MLVLAALALLAGACSEGSDAVVEPETIEPSPTLALPSDSAEPSPAEESWRDRFSQDQVASYQAALARWQEYSEQTAEIYRAGRDTEAARAVFREYDMQAVARIKSLAETYDAQQLRTIQGPTALSTTPVSIEARVVVISQCNDYSDVEVTRAGKPVQGVVPEHVQTPILIEMDKAAGHDWMVARVQLEDEKPCAP